MTKPIIQEMVKFLILLSIFLSEVITVLPIAISMSDQIKTVLAIESSCDETAVAVLRGNATKVGILCSEISSQVDIHREYGGVVPELASRNHSLSLRPLVELALKNAGVTLQEIDCFSATAGPGLASSLLVGHTAAKAMSVATGKPFVSVNHMEGHLLSPFIESKSGKGIEPNIALVVSGGHTMILDTQEFGKYELIGKTLDDAAGEAFDKVAKMLLLPYPGGPEIEKCALTGDPKAYAFPRSMKKKPHYNFSFSGLKTAVLYTLSQLNSEDGSATKDQLPDLCASFQEAVIDVLVYKTMKVTLAKEAKIITLSGGVSCNSALRQAFQTECDKHGIQLMVCSPVLSTDNAVMIGYIALHKCLRLEFSDLSEDINPNLPLNALVLR